MATPKENFISKLTGTKARVESGLRSVGKNISANVEQGQKDLNSGKAKYYASINPLKGARTAFKKGYKSQ